MSVSMPFVPYRPSGSRKRVLAIGVLAVAAVAGVAVGMATGGAGAAGAGQLAMDADYVRLMRFMAGTKALMALAAACAILWRLGAPVGAVRFGAYAAAVAAMAAGPGLIWGMAHIVAGSVLLHGGLLASALLLWRDPGTALVLEAAITRRRLKRLGS